MKWSEINEIVWKKNGSQKTEKCKKLKIISKKGRKLFRNVENKKKKTKYFKRSRSTLESVKSCTNRQDGLRKMKNSKKIEFLQKKSEKIKKLLKTTQIGSFERKMSWTRTKTPIKLIAPK